MSVTALSVVPTNHLWQPTREAADMAVRYLRQVDGKAVDISAEFRDLEVVMDCCARRISFNEVLGRLTWPMAFASFSLRVETPTGAWTSPDQPWFTADEMARVTALIGHECRQVLAHY